MGSLGGEVARKKAMLMHPKVMGANPSERWGHSACYFNGLLYIFGGCRGGVHFSDVLVCNLDTLTWNNLKTSGQGPGPRDSHSAVIVGHKMIVFGGTNGSKKVNDLHILDLLSREWTRPEYRGNPPCPRESHTANVINEQKLIILGGSGEGEANYLNDLHILDLKNMEWTSPEVGGCIPAPRDSHSAVNVGNRLFVFGGDSGDRYQGDICVLDMNTLIWSRLDARGPSPGARAGHASVSIGTKVLVVGGVGDKQYYNDIWDLDVNSSSWHQLDTCLQKSQGRFSHTATVTNIGIALFGGCGEDERPLSELVVLRIDSLASNTYGSMYDKDAKIFQRKAQHNLVPCDLTDIMDYAYISYCRMEFMIVLEIAMLIHAGQYLLQKTTFVGNNEDSATKDAQELELVSRHPFRFSSDMLHPKRRRTCNSKMHETKQESEEHSLSLSQHSSPSQSDREQAPVMKSNRTYPSSRVHPLFREKVSTPNNYQLNHVPVNPIECELSFSRACKDIHLSSELPNLRKQQHKNAVCNDACELQYNAAESSSLKAGKFQNLIGAEVRGQVDGAFDSGYLMTAVVNGKIFRGVLFPPGPEVVSRGAILGQHSSSFTHPTTDQHVNASKNHLSFAYPRHSQQVVKQLVPRSDHCSERAQSRKLSPVKQGPLSLGKDLMLNSELQGVVLTLGGPGSEYGRS